MDCCLVNFIYFITQLPSLQSKLLLGIHVVVFVVVVAVVAVVGVIAGVDVAVAQL